jgi:hypothetical protein
MLLAVKPVLKKNATVDKLPTLTSLSLIPNLKSKI